MGASGMTWADAENCECWHDVFRSYSSGGGDRCVGVYVGKDMELEPAFAAFRDLESDDPAYVRIQTVLAYRELASGLHLLANKASAAADGLGGTKREEHPLEQIAIDLANEMKASMKRHGGGAVTIAEGRLFQYLRARGWRPPE
jgi:hypothetical protein